MTGGSESAVNAIGIAGFCAMKALSTRNDEPEKASRPFDQDRDGFVLGEGSCILILEEYESAKRRGAKIYAEVVGYGTSCDAYHITAPSEGGEGAERAMRMALQMSNLQPNEIDYVNAHGTSTDANDRNESAAIARVFEDYAHNGLCVSSTKSVTGHLLGAAGAIEAAFSVLSMRDSRIPPTINLDQPGEGCTLDYVPNVARDKAVKACLSNSFGFGGTNASLVFKAVD
jgi:3-oxoacyl-[acyl-carrier-protein] synthase II